MPAFGADYVFTVVEGINGLKDRRLERDLRELLAGIDAPAGICHLSGSDGLSLKKYPSRLAAEAPVFFSSIQSG